MHRPTTSRTSLPWTRKSASRIISFTDQPSSASDRNLTQPSNRHNVIHQYRQISTDTPVPTNHCKHTSTDTSLQTHQFCHITAYKPVLTHHCRHTHTNTALQTNQFRHITADTPVPTHHCRHTSTDVDIRGFITGVTFQGTTLSSAPTGSPPKAIMR